MHIAAIQIAAGLSSRMKGPNKLLQEIGQGKTLIQHTFGELKASSVDEVVVVTGRDAQLVNHAINKLEVQGSRFKVVHNENFELGMTTSIQAGLKAAQDADAVMICLSDMPLLQASDYNRLIESFRKLNNTKAILAPFSGTKKGNPVIFGSAYFTAMSEHQEMNGCSAIVKQNQASLIKLPVDSEAYFFDIDTPETLADYKARVK